MGMGLDALRSQSSLVAAVDCFDFISSCRTQPGARSRETEHWPGVNIGDGHQLPLALRDVPHGG
jgi:hypothetical protein